MDGSQSYSRGGAPFWPSWAVTVMCTNMQTYPVCTTGGGSCVAAPMKGLIGEKYRLPSLVIPSLFHRNHLRRTEALNDNACLQYQHSGLMQEDDECTGNRCLPSIKTQKTGGGDSSAVKRDWSSETHTNGRWLTNALTPAPRNLTLSSGL